MGHPKPESSAVGERIRSAIALLRNVSGDSMEELGAVLGVSRTVAGQRVDGRSRFTAEEVAAAAAHYGVPVEAIYAGPADCHAALAATSAEAVG